MLLAQSEVEDILRDAGSKLNRFKDALAKQRDSSQAEGLTKALTDRHDREKAAAQAELESAKSRLASREKELEASYAEKLSLQKVIAPNLVDLFWIFHK